MAHQFDKVSDTRKRLIRKEIIRRQQARGAVRGAVAVRTGAKVSGLAKGVGRATSLAGLGLNKDERDYAKAIRSSRQKTGKTTEVYRAAVKRGKTKVDPLKPAVLRHTMKDIAKGGTVGPGTAKPVKEGGRPGARKEAQVWRRTRIASLKEKHGAGTKAYKTARTKVVARHAKMIGKKKK